MNLFGDSGVSDFTRGGQTTLHFFRMIGQVIGKFFKYFILICILSSSGIYYALTDEYERYVGMQWSIAWLHINALAAPETEMRFETAKGKPINTRADIVVRDKFVKTYVDSNRMAIAKAVLISLGVGFFALYLSLRFVFRQGSSLRKEKHMRGVDIVDSKMLRRMLRKNRAISHITLAGTPIVKGSETSNILVTGSPGTGKSVMIRELIKQIREKGDRAIIYSSSGEFIEQFYREDKDTILNPLDARCPAWNVWAECKGPPDFDSLAASLIPESTSSSDPFWTMAPRMLFSSVAMKLASAGNTSNRELLNTLLSLELDQVASIVRGTIGSTLLAEGAEKTALSVRASLAPYIGPLKYLKDSDAPFSIKQWVAKEEGDSCIFISSRSDQRDILKPLISLWLDIATSAIMSLEADRDRRVWVIIDELPSLNRLPSLLNFLPQGRKYGGCALISFQSFAQLVSLYTQKGAESLTGMCDTWASYRVNEPATADWLSKAIGVSEVKEVNEGISYGSNEIRDGANSSFSRKSRALVLPSELMNLPNFTGYLRVQGSYPIVKFNTHYIPYTKVANGYIEGEYDASLWDFTKTKNTFISDDNGEEKSKEYDVAKSREPSGKSPEDDNLFHTF